MQVISFNIALLYAPVSRPIEINSYLFYKITFHNACKFRPSIEMNDDDDSALKVRDDGLKKAKENLCVIVSHNDVGCHRWRRDDLDVMIK